MQLNNKPFYHYSTLPHDSVCKITHSGLRMESAKTNETDLFYEIAKLQGYEESEI